MADGEGRETATLGGGCFWCLEAVYQEMEGVDEVLSGYAGGHVEHPTYEQVCRKDTGHAEVVRIRFDPQVTTFRELLEVFFTIHDPTTRDRQGADVGPQYRSAIFWESEAQRRTAEEVIRDVEETGAFEGPVVTQVAPLERFWPAEGYHRDYYRRNQSQPYCRVVIDPKLARFRKSFTEKRKG